MQSWLKGLNVYLIGLMGTGKSTVGKELATRLQYRFFDTDDLIEKSAKVTINEIFATHGETAFRDLESQVLAEISAYHHNVIATGGGIVLRPFNWSYLHHGLIVWLDTPIDLLVKRLAEDRTRPLLHTADLKTKLIDLLEQRHSLYAQADLHVTIIEEETPDAIADKIERLIPSVLK